MQIMIAVGVVIGFALLFLLGRWTAPKPEPPVPIKTFLAEVDGSPPRWSVDHLADRVASAICLQEKDRVAQVIEAVRSTHVRFVPHRFQQHDPSLAHEHGVPAAVYYGIGRVVIQDGEGWERRLAWALCQRVRIELHGSPAQLPDAMKMPAFAAADVAAKEIADGHVAGNSIGAGEVGAVVPG